MKIEYKIASRGTMVVHVGEKKVSVDGELTFSPSVFYANINSIRYWDAPNENIKIKEEEIRTIISTITEVSQNSGTKILFD